MRDRRRELAERREPLLLYQLGGEPTVLAAFVAEDIECAREFADFVAAVDEGRLALEIAIGDGAHRGGDIGHRLGDTADHEAHREDTEAEEEEGEGQRAGEALCRRARFASGLRIGEIECGIGDVHDRFEAGIGEIDPFDAGDGGLPSGGDVVDQCFAARTQILEIEFLRLGNAVFERLRQVEPARIF